MAKRGDAMRKKKKLSSNQIMFHCMVWIPLLFIIVFNYVPMITGFSVAFKDYKPGLGDRRIPLGWPEAFPDYFYDG